jgi:hypothetical protein
VLTIAYPRFAKAARLLRRRNKLEFEFACSEVFLKKGVIAVSIIILKKRRIWFGYSCQVSEGYDQSTKYVCDLSQASVQFIPYKKNGCLVYYESYMSATERMVLRNFLPEEISKLRKLTLETIVNQLLPDVEAVFKETFCLHTSEEGKDVRFGGSFALASEDGIFEIGSNRDVSDEGSFFASRQGLLSFLLTKAEPVSEKKAQEAIDTDSWHYYGGKKIYDPMIFGYLGDDIYTLYDADDRPHKIRKEELECL